MQHRARAEEAVVVVNTSAVTDKQHNEAMGTDAYQQFVIACNFLYSTRDEILNARLSRGHDGVAEEVAIAVHETTKHIARALNTFGVEILFEADERGTLAFSWALKDLEMITTCIARTDDTDIQNIAAEIRNRCESLLAYARTLVHQFLFPDGANGRHWEVRINPGSEGVFGLQSQSRHYKSEMTDLIRSGSFKNALRLLCNAAQKSGQSTHIGVFDRSLLDGFTVRQNTKYTLLFDGETDVLTERLAHDKFSNEEKLQKISEKVVALMER